MILFKIFLLLPFDEPKIKLLLNSLINGDQKMLQILLQKFIVNSMSSFDLSANEIEKSYHLFILGLLVQFHDLFQVKSNRESGYGRYDITLIPRNPALPGMVLEFKRVHEEPWRDARRRSKQCTWNKLKANITLQNCTIVILSMSICLPLHFWVKKF